MFARRKSALPASMHACIEVAFPFMSSYSTPSRSATAYQCQRNPAARSAVSRSLKNSASTERRPALGVFPQKVLGGRIFDAERDFPSWGCRVFVGLKLAVDQVRAHDYSSFFTYSFGVTLA